ncbi:hypothetical protein D3C86_1896080 [compost metagenome]
MHPQFGAQQLGRTGFLQSLVEALELALVLDRVPDGHDRLAHPADGFLQRGDAALQFVGFLEGRVDQHQRALLRHRQQRPRQVPALAQVHGDAAVAVHVFLEQATVFGVFLVEVQAILFAGQHARQFR